MPKQGAAKSMQLPEDRKMIAARLGMTWENLSRDFAALRPIGVGGRGCTMTIVNLDRRHEFRHHTDLL